MDNKVYFFIRQGLFVILLLLCFSCNKKSNIDEEFYIPVEGSRLYVRLVGNVDGPLILNLHGGPGAFSGFDHEHNKEYLEHKYLMAYLDQRGGGKSDKEPDSTMFTMDQFVKDVDVVVDTLKSKFMNKKVNLLGSSWGGTLGLLYLIKHQDKINSFACVSGKADGVYPIMAIIEHEKKIVEDLMNTSQDSTAKKRYKEIYSKLVAVENSELDQFYNDMNLIKHTFPKELGFDAYWANLEARKRAIELGKDSLYYSKAHYTKEEFNEAMEKFEYVNRVFRNSPTYNHLNILDDISKISKPVLVVQGQYDYAIGIGQAKMIYEALKSVPVAKKELIIIPNAAHNLNMEAQKQYYMAINSFFAKYND
ncbi:alpha/beta hydrolase [Galbibacter sp. PAP.153]|uniref:alpha/beta hydrolase n=1 Tax=Galbibacter sp. PAP.153 TaxID=3104623 RepID=UPI00300A6497